MSQCWLLVLIQLSVWILFNNAEYMEGDVNLLDSEGFGFLGHWMFGHNVGNSTEDSWKMNRYKAGTLDITLRLHKPLDEPTLFELALYDDQPGSWWALRANKSNMCVNGERLNTSIPREYTPVEFRADPHDGNDTWTARINIHEHIVPRWWWVYLVKCDFAKTPAGDFVKNDIHYKLHWQQADTIAWNRELSLNEEFQNTFHAVVPWFTLSLFAVQAVAYGLHWNQSRPKGYVHNIVKLLTVLLFLQFIAMCFQMAYWLHLTYSGYKEFGILTFSFLFEISASIIFLYLLCAIFAFGWRLSVGDLNKKLNYVLIAVCVCMEVIEFIIFVWSYEYYPDEEATLYRYTEKPQVIYGTFMLIFGLIWFALVAYGSVRDHVNGVSTKIQRNARLSVSFALLWSWFIWPILAVSATKTFGIHRMDFACDVISWCMKMLSFFILVFAQHPANPYYDRLFDLGRTMVHARYEKNESGVFENDEDDDDLESDDNEQQLGKKPASEMQMNEIKQSTVFSTKKKEKKKDKKKGGKLFQYGNRNQLPQDSDDEEESDESDSNIQADAAAVGMAGNNVPISAISIDAAKNDAENETLRAEKGE